MRMVPRLIANFETGEGSIEFKRFMELDPLLRADLCKDWAYWIDLLYRGSVWQAYRKETPAYKEPVDD